MIRNRSTPFISLDDCDGNGTDQVMIVLIDSLEQSLVDMAIAESTRFDGFESLGELDYQLST
jgi:hypothetical protein